MTKRTILVTGGSRGIGAAIAREFAAAGDRIAVHYSSAITDAQEVVNSLAGTGHIIVQADLRDADAIKKMVDSVAQVLLCETPLPGQGFIAHKNIETPEGVIRLASPGDDEEFAHILYSALRAADAQGLAEVVVMQPIGIGIAVAIRDRLARAANGR